MAQSKAGEDTGQSIHAVYEEASYVSIQRGIELGTALEPYSSSRRSKAVNSTGNQVEPAYVCLVGMYADTSPIRWPEDPNLALS